MMTLHLTLLLLKHFSCFGAETMICVIGLELCRLFWKLAPDMGFDKDNSVMFCSTAIFLKIRG